MQKSRKRDGSNRVFAGAIILSLCIGLLGALPFASATESGLPGEPTESMLEPGVSSRVESQPEPEASSSLKSQPEASAPEVDVSSSVTSMPEESSGVESGSEEPVKAKSFTAGREPNTSGRIVVDGDISDWKNVPAVALPGQGNGWNSVDSMRMAMDTEGNVYLCLEGTANQYNLDGIRWSGMNITQNGATQYYVSLDFLVSQGAQLETGGAVGNDAGDVCAELCIPASYFTDGNFTISYQNVTVAAGDMAVMDGVPLEEEEPVYQGIVIDGSFADWDAVTKYPGNDPNDNLKNAAAVFDGDWVYLYLEEYPGCSATGTGTQGNGKYSIKTDLGKEFVFQLNRDGTVSCPAEDASCQHNGTRWEVAIPASALPEYLNTLDFGIYLHEPMVTDIANLNGQGGGGSFSGIVYDGLYGDWAYYPHTTIQYATQGTEEVATDAKGALYVDGSSLYGHVKSNMPVHVETGGSELLNAVTIRFDGIGDLSFRPVLVGEDGSINYNPDISSLHDGTYEFYLIHTGDSQDLKNINDVNNPDYDKLAPYGRIMITATDSQIEGEFLIDLEKVAKRFDCSPQDFKTISAQFGRLGQQWITISGTPTGAWLGVLLCLLTVLGVTWFRRRRQTA